MSVAAHEWEGRPITFKDFTVKDLNVVRDAFAVSSATGMWTVLALSAVYLDDGTRVFADADAVEASPAKLAPRLTRMAAAAMQANGMSAGEAAIEGDPPLV